MSILRKFSNPFGSSADNSWIREWYAPYWFLLPIHGLTHSLPNIFLLYYWIPAAINKMQTGIIISSFQGFSILVGIYVNKLRGNNCVIHTTWYTVCTDKEYNTKVVYSLNTTWYTVCTDKEYNTKVVYCLLYHVTGPLPCDRAFTVWQGRYYVTGPLPCDRAFTMWQGLYYVTGPLPCDRAFTMWQGLYHVTGPLLCDRAFTMWQGFYHVTGLLPCDRAFTMWQGLYCASHILQFYCR
jgi:hypothetical protein